MAINTKIDVDIAKMKLTKISFSLIYYSTTSYD